MRNILPTDLSRYDSDISLQMPFYTILPGLIRAYDATIVEEDETSVAAFLTGVAAELVISKCNWHADHLNDRQVYTIRLLIHELADRLCQSLEASSAQVSSYCEAWVFRNDENYMFGASSAGCDKLNLKTGSDGRLASVNMLLVNCIDAWVGYRDFYDIGRIARVTTMLANTNSQERSVRKLPVAHRL